MPPELRRSFATRPLVAILRRFTAFHTVVAALVPVAALAITNLEWVRFTPSAAMRPAIAILIAVAFLLRVLRPIISDPWVRSAGLSAWLVLIALYETTYSHVERLAGSRVSEPYVAAGYLVGATVVAAILAPRLARSENRVLLNGCAAGMSLLTAALILHKTSPWTTPRWACATASIQRGVSESTLVPPADPPDVYYFLADGLTHPDTLRALYGAGLPHFEATLQSRGFDVATKSRSNYAHTHLSLASSLNMAYLDPLASVMGDASDPTPLHDLIFTSGVVRRFRELGYEFVMIGSSFSLTVHHPLADRCICGLVHGLSEFESALLEYFPFRVLPMSPLTFGAHRKKILDGFTAAERVRRGERPMFVFVHILAPHPPFVFHADGRPRSQTSRFSFYDGTFFDGSVADYERGYAEQAEFIQARLLQTIDRIDRSGSRPVIIVQGDHGARPPRYERGDRSVERERLSITLAARVPGSPLANDITPVNVFRELFDRVFGGSFASLPNRSYFSEFERPYRLWEVPAE